MTHPPNLIRIPTSIHTIGHPPPYEPIELASVRAFTATRPDEHDSLRWLRGLERLRLVGDLEAAAHLPPEAPLVSLTLCDLASGGIGSVGSRPTLRELVIDHCNISRLDTLDDFPALERLRIERSQLLVGPSFGPRLRDIAVCATTVGDLTALENTRDVEHLTIRSTDLSDLGALVKWLESGRARALSHLDLRYNPWDEDATNALGRLALMCDRRGIGVQLSSEEATRACRWLADTGMPIFVTDHAPDGSVELTWAGPRLDAHEGTAYLRVDEDALERLLGSGLFDDVEELWLRLEEAAAQRRGATWQ